MGLNFRKSINLIPGVKLNLSKSGASISTGVKGLRKSINTKGQVTTTASIPGTGIYYTDKKSLFGDKKKDSKKKSEKKTEKESTKKTTKKTAKKEETAEQPVQQTAAQPVQQPAPVQPVQPAPAYAPAPAQINTENLKAIHKVADDTIDWSEIMASPTPPDGGYNAEMWSYYYAAAPKVLDGDIDAYLQLIDEVNPLGDLLAYGINFEFGTDDPRKMEVEYVVNQAVLADAKRALLLSKYNDLLQDFVCSLSIRIARDIFALLPVSDVVVHAVLGSNTVLSVDFDRDTLDGVKFGFVDPSDVMSRFRHNMKFSANLGFYPVDRV